MRNKYVEKDVDAFKDGVVDLFTSGKDVQFSWMLERSHGVVESVIFRIGEEGKKVKFRVPVEFLNQISGSVEDLLEKIGQDMSTHGWHLPYENDMAALSLTEEGFQTDHLEAAMRHVERFGTAIDVGAHIGTWTVKLCERFEMVHAFEGFPPTFMALIKNLNDRKLENVKVYKSMLGNRPGFVKVGYAVPEENLKNSVGVYIMDYVERQEGANILVNRLDDVKIHECDFLKIDAEGFEPAVLQGAEKLIRKCKPVIMMEWKPEYWERCNLDGDKVIKELGLELIDEIEHDRIYRCGR